MARPDRRLDCLMPVVAQDNVAVLPALEAVILCCPEQALEPLQQVGFQRAVVVSIRNEVAHGPLAADFDGVLTAAPDSIRLLHGELRGSNCRVVLTGEPAPALLGCG